MPTQQYILELEAKVKGELEVEKLQQQIADLTAEFKKQQGPAGQAAGLMEEYAAKIAPLRARIEEIVGGHKAQTQAALEAGKAAQEAAQAQMRAAQEAQDAIDRQAKAMTDLQSAYQKASQVSAMPAAAKGEGESVAAFHVRGQVELASLRKEMADAVSAFQRLDAAGQQAQGGLAGFASKVAPLQDRIHQLGRAMGGVGGPAANSGRAILEFSRAVEDSQYGLKGVLNNIPTLVQAMGQGAGVAGAASLAAVGVALLVEHWDELAELWGGGHTKTEAEQMEELGKQTAKTAEETLRLLQYERERKTLEGIRTRRPEQEETRAKKVEDAVVEGGKDQIVEGLVNTGFISKTPEMVAADKELAAAQQNMKKDHTVFNELGVDEELTKLNKEAAASRLRKAQQEQERTYTEAGEKTITGAANNKGDLENLIKHMEQFPDVFSEELIKSLKDGADYLGKKVEDATAKEAKEYEEREKVLNKRSEEEIKKREDAEKKVKDDYEGQEEAQNRTGDKIIAQREKDEKEAEQEAEKARQEAERKHNKDVAEGTKAINRRDPGLGDRLQMELGLREANGQSAEQAMQQMETKLAEELKNLSDGKLNDEDARKQARERIEDAQGDLNKSVYDRMMNPDQPERKTVSVHGIRDFVDSIQTSFNSGNVGDKQLKVQEQIRDILAQQKAATMQPVWG